MGGQGQGKKGGGGCWDRRGNACLCGAGLAAVALCEGGGADDGPGDPPGACQRPGLRLPPAPQQRPAAISAVAAAAVGAVGEPRLGLRDRRVTLSHCQALARDKGC